MATTKLGLAEVAVSQGSKEETINAAIRALEALAIGGVINATTATPPGSPAAGDAYIIAASPTGAWAGKANNIAVFDNGAWVFYPPFTGFNVWNIALQATNYWTGSAWAALTAALTDGDKGDVVVSGGGTVWTVEGGTGGGLTWSEATGTTQTIAVDNGYIANNVAQVVFTLPTTAAIGKTFEIVGKGAGGWKIAQGSGQQIVWNSVTTTSGTGGYVESAAPSLQYATARLVCITANTTFQLISNSVLNLV